MRDSMRGEGYRGRMPSAVERLDKQCSRYMGWSLVTAIAIHAVLLVSWPKWTVPPTEAMGASGMVQTEAVALLDAEEGMIHDAIVGAAQEAVHEELEPQPITEPMASRGPDLAEIDHILEARSDEVRVPVMARGTLDHPAELVLEPMTAFSPGMVLAHDFTPLWRPLRSSLVVRQEWFQVL